MLNLKRNGISNIRTVTAVVLIIAAGIGILGFLNSFWASNGNTSSTTLYIGGTGQPYATIPLTLHSVQYAENVVGARLVLPDPTLVGSSFNIVGVRINDLPSSVNSTASNGFSVEWIQWSITVFVWDKTFTNGTSNIDI